MEDVTKIYSQFKQVGQQVEIIRNMYGKAKELDELTGENVAFTEEAYKLLDTVKEFVSLVEESDTNLDPEKTKLEGVDNLFKGHFVTDHMNNVFNEVYNSQGVPANALGKEVDKPCCDECTDSCPCDDKQDCIERDVIPKTTYWNCPAVCSQDTCTCEDNPKYK